MQVSEGPCGPNPILPSGIRLDTSNWTLVRTSSQPAASAKFGVCSNFPPFDELSHALHHSAVSVEFCKGSLIRTCCFSRSSTKLLFLPPWLDDQRHETSVAFLGLVGCFSKSGVELWFLFPWLRSRGSSSCSDLTIAFYWPGFDLQFRAVSIRNCFVASGLLYCSGGGDSGQNPRGSSRFDVVWPNWLRLRFAYLFAWPWDTAVRHNASSQEDSRLDCARQFDSGLKRRNPSLSQY